MMFASEVATEWLISVSVMQALGLSSVPYLPKVRMHTNLDTVWDSA